MSVFPEDMLQTNIIGHFTLIYEKIKLNIEQYVPYRCLKVQSRCNARKIKSIYYNFCVCKPECIRPITINTQSFSGLSPLLSAGNAAQRLSCAPAHGVSGHFNYAFVTVNSDIF